MTDITQEEVQEAIAKEMAMFLEENREVIIKRALAKVREVRKDAEKNESAKTE